MEGTLAAQLREALDAGRGLVLGGRPALVLATLESGARVALDADARWFLVNAEGSVREATAGDEHVLYEALEQKRTDFEAALEQGARAAGVDPDAVVLAFPAVAVVRAVLARRVPYLVRLALLWLLPTELRELRDDIVRVSKGSDLPLPVRELAEHLVVPA
jgi:hypothetical protein